MRRFFAALTGALLLIVGLAATPAAAVDPMTATGIVTDKTNTLSQSDIDKVESAVAALEDEDGVTMYLVVVDTFTNPTSGFDWATAFAERNQLVSTDIVMYVGLNAGEAGINVARDLDLTNSDIQTIENRDMIPRLNQGDVAGAAVATADGLRTTLGDGAAGGSDGSGTSGGNSANPAAAATGFVILLVPIALVVGGLIIWFVVRGARERRRKRAKLAQRQQSIAELGTRASAQLVQVDDLVKAAEQDAAFAEAEFGADAAAPFREAVKTARAQTNDAFALQGKLLDHITDSEQEQVSWNEQILQLTQQAGARIRDEQQRFQALRDMERNAPQLLARVTADAEAFSARLTTAGTALEGLRGRYAPAALVTVDDAVSQAESLLQLAVAEAQQADALLREGKSGLAAVDIGDAQEALAQGETLLNAIEQTRSDLEQAAERIRAEIEDLRADVGHLQAMTTQGAGDEFEARNASAMSLASQAVDRAMTEGTSPQNPLATLRALRDANAGLDEALKATSEEQARLEGVRRRLDRAIEQGRAQIRSAADYISTHRGAVSPAPRTRLSQAESELARAQQLAIEHPDEALAAANAALKLSQAASDSAADDVRRERNRYDGGGYGSGSFGNSRRSSSSSGMGDAILGGIIGGILSGGGGSRGGGFRGSSGSRGGFGGSSGFRAGGFGGGGGFRSSGGFRGGGGRR